MTDTKVDTSATKCVGNTMPHTKKRNPRSREWVFTSYEETFPKEFDSKVRYVIYQQEICPKTNKKHWQGYAEFVNPITYLNVHKYLNTNNKLHVEQREAERSKARDYCRKKDTAIEGTQFEWGEWREVSQGKRSDIDEIGALVKQGVKLRDIANEYPGQWIRFGRGISSLSKVISGQRKEKTEVTILWGPTGVGKSHRANEELPNAYWYTLNGWWDGYDCHEEVIMEEIALRDINRREILMLCDKFPYKVNMKGSSCEFVAKKMIITTNDNPETWFEFIPELRRRIEKIIYMGKEELKGDMN